MIHLGKHISIVTSTFFYQVENMLSYLHLTIILLIYNHRMARRLIKEEGLLCGGSSGASMAIAMKAAKNLKKGQKCVVVLPDSVRNYINKFLNDEWLAERDIIELEKEKLW